MKKPTQTFKTTTDCGHGLIRLWIEELNEHAVNVLAEELFGELARG